MSSQILTDQASIPVQVWVRLLRGHAATRKQVSAELQGEHGLSINDYECLLVLSQAEENAMRRVDLAEELQLTASGVTRLLDGLEAGELVAKRKCDADGRVTYAVLTDAGRRRLEEAGAAHIAQIQALFEERYTPDELATLSELLSRLPGAGAPVNEAECTASSSEPARHPA